MRPLCCTSLTDRNFTTPHRPTGMNDPNGLVYYQGQWHLFHQHRYPGSDNIVWAHAASPDLLHWKHLGVRASGR